MKHFPNNRPARLAGLEHCITHAHRDDALTWRALGRVLVIGLLSLAGGLLLLGAFIAIHQ